MKVTTKILLRCAVNRWPVDATHAPLRARQSRERSACHLAIRVFLGIFAIFNLAGCGKKSEETPVAEKAPRAIQQDASDKKSETKAKAEALSVLAEADVKGVVEKWLAAQNAGKFEDYEKLFAERFIGVKRVGSRQESFDRKAWLTDRAQMFQRDFTVTIEDVQIATSGASAIVQFLQTWTSATFQDKGPKRLIVVRGKNRLEIAKEEMLESSLAGQHTSGHQTDARNFAFVWGGLLMVDELDSLASVTGHPAPTTDNTTSRPIDAALLPEAHRSLVGEEFALYGTTGKLCTARVKNLRVHVELQPHFGQEQHWAGFNGEPAVSPEQRALQLWELSQMGGRFLAAELEIPPGCAGAVWARSVKLPEPALLQSRKPTEEEEKMILKEARRQAPYLAEQRAYHGNSGSNVPWEETRGGSVRIVVFEGASGVQYADVSMFHTGGGCGADYEGIFWALVRKKGDSYVSVNAAPGEHVTSAWPRQNQAIRSDVAFDLEGDGIPEFMGEHDLIRSENGTFRAVFNQSPAYFDCPC